MGKEDELNHAQSNGWEYHTKKRCTIHHFTGRHFFINDEITAITTIVNNTLRIIETELLREALACLIVGHYETCAKELQ